eukprot:6950060-Heterocapsa_arctica.AAC.1
MGQGREDERSALFEKLPRFANVCADAFAGLPMFVFTKHVASMSIALHCRKDLVSTRSSSAPPVLRPKR